MKFRTVEDGSGSTGGRTKLWPILCDLKDITIKAWNDEPGDDREEQESIEVIKQYPELAWAVIEETDTPATAYSRAASLRKANLPSGTWSFKGQKTVNEDGEECGEVLARYESEEQPPAEADTDDTPPEGDVNF